jgi:hypothetical protein
VLWERNTKLLRRLSYLFIWDTCPGCTARVKLKFTFGVQQFWMLVSVFVDSISSQPSARWLWVDFDLHACISRGSLIFSRESGCLLFIHSHLTVILRQGECLENITDRDDCWQAGNGRSRDCGMYDLFAVLQVLCAF